MLKNINRPMKMLDTIKIKLLRNNRYSYSLTKVFNGNNSKKDQREDQFSL